MVPARVGILVLLLLSLTGRASAWFWSKKDEGDKHENALNKMDTNGDGLLSLEELTAESNWNDEDGGLNRELTKLFPKADADHDGLLTKEELANLFDVHYAAAHEARGEL
eukprot:TRINITY_DN83616_c0_g1_i1.p1 TRINITY_DN83616_c0_g1~~TRINITY_DN83616_c0_g1_i1.p1  ORF type:complete len:110 (-),score=31.81 TRINITY_DN83616_c0_g1_i1:57-386(-)